MTAVSDPLALAREWIPAGPNPCLMTLATVDDGVPDARTLLLSDLDARGFHFHTDARSRKVAQLEANPHVALVMFLEDAARQLVVQGVARRMTPEEAAVAYGQRSAYLRRLAWVNTPEVAALDLDERRSRWSAFGAAHGDDLAAPESWAGFVVEPTRLTFWSGAADAPSRRVEYTLSDERWRESVRAG
ncbi:MAG: pyridoxal 5'-phosphate synthase [Demequina sp.]|uniref:pyridoxine/pyridoxamine 5'-phosphate oxidase n=1 Tax=Demequina sp. TaxID=2050685 RepID=UPI003A897F18